MYSTPIDAHRTGKQIAVGKQLCFLGSCFADRIGERIKLSHWPAVVNPCGIHFNPVSLATSIADGTAQLMSSAIQVTQGEEGSYFSYNYSTRYSSDDVDDTRRRLSEDLRILHSGISQSSHVFITLGTSWVYHLLESGQVVANCHRQAQDRFRKALLSPQEVSTALARLVDDIVAVNPAVELIFTVSPVRHLRDGLIDNQRSKAALLTGAHTIVAAHEQCHYFPAYEIMMDELRDYRWYADDMLHPSPLAVRIIYERLVNTWFDEESTTYLQEWSQLSTLLSHRPHHPQSEEAQKFIVRRNQAHTDFLSRYPWASSSNSSSQC